jgi:phage-related baseplate assembly protein
MPTQPKIFDNIDLSGVPLPTVIDEPDFEALFSARVEKFRELDPNYDLLLESDPAAKVMQVSAYMDMLLRFRVNNAARQTLLGFSTGDSLERVHGDALGVERLTVTPANNEVIPPIPAVMESDERYAYRIQLRHGASSTAGGITHYKYHAMTADANVRDVAVYSPNHYPYYNTGGLVMIAVLGDTGNLIPNQTVLDNVRNKVTAPEVKVLTDIVQVEAAIMRSVNVAAEVYLLPRTPLSVFSELDKKLRDAVAEKQALGWDLTRSWIISQLQSQGVHSVELVSPTNSHKIAPNEFPSLGDVTLVFKGFSDFEADVVSDMEKRRLSRLMYDTYIEYATGNRRTHQQIAEDLTYREKIGVIQPTVIGLAKHLQLDVMYQIENIDNKLEVDLAYAIWFYLASNNGYLPVGTPNILNFN